MVVRDRIMDRSTVQHEDKYSFSFFVNKPLVFQGISSHCVFSSAAATAEM